MIEANLIIEIAADEKGDSAQYVPSESLDNLNVGVMIDRLESRGKWQIDLPIRQFMNERWIDALNSRSDYLKSMRKLRLEELACLPDAPAKDCKNSELDSKNN